MKKMAPFLAAFLLLTPLVTAGNVTNQTNQTNITRPLPFRKPEKNPLQSIKDFAAKFPWRRAAMGSIGIIIFISGALGSFFGSLLPGGAMIGYLISGILFVSMFRGLIGAVNRFAHSGTKYALIIASVILGWLLLNATVATVWG